MRAYKKRGAKTTRKKRSKTTRKASPSLSTRKKKCLCCQNLNSRNKTTRKSSKRRAEAIHKPKQEIRQRIKREKYENEAAIKSNCRCSSEGNERRRRQRKYFLASNYPLAMCSFPEAQIKSWKRELGGRETNCLFEYLANEEGGGRRGQ